MTPEQAFDTGARIYLTDAKICEDAHGRFLAGTVGEGGHESWQPGLRILSSYVIKEIYDDVFLTRTGFTLFVESWEVQKDNSTVD